MSDGSNNARDCYECDDYSLDACQGCLHQHSSETNNDKKQSDYCDNQIDAS